MKTSNWYRSIASLSQHMLGAAAAPVTANNTITLPGYGSFSGLSINATLTGRALPGPVDAWLGLDFATQPVGELRFAPVGLPEPFAGVKAATSYGKSCIQDPSVTSYAQDEACLNVNIYRTPGVALTQKLPVLVWFHGGSFVYGSSRAFDGAAFAASSKEPVVVVTPHYRLNSLGFLPSRVFEEEGLLNLGLRDQRLFLEFLQKYAASFGADPDRVTIGGRSAGGHSVGIHYMHNYGDTAGKPLFNQAWSQSGSSTARAFPPSDYPLYVQQFATFMEYLHCPTDNNTAALACLRAANITDIQTISVNIFDDSEYGITWPFQPSLGGPLLERPGSVSGIEGTFHHLPLITSSVSDEAKYYSPGNLTTNDEFLGFLHNISPNMTDHDVSELNELYPDPATDATSPYANSPNSTQYNRISAALSDYMYICPGQESAYRAAVANVTVWKAHFDVPNNTPAWQGVPHTSDTKYTWNAPDVQYPAVSPVYFGYLSSYVTTGNPNTFKAEGAPDWPRYQPSGYGLDSAPASQLRVNTNSTVVESDTIRREQCLWWRDPERAARLNK